MAAPLLFCGDTLFSGGCGRLFEGTPAQMLASLDKLAALPGDTRVCCTHEYTLSNLNFARAVEPGNADLVHYIAALRSTARARDIPPCPRSIALERAINPFLRTARARGRAGRARLRRRRPATTRSPCSPPSANGKTNSDEDLRLAGLAVAALALAGCAAAAADTRPRRRPPAASGPRRHGAAAAPRRRHSRRARCSPITAGRGRARRPSPRCSRRPTCGTASAAASRMPDLRRRPGAPAGAVVRHAGPTTSSA